MMATRVVDGDVSACEQTGRPAPTSAADDIVNIDPANVNTSGGKNVFRNKFLRVFLVYLLTLLFTTLLISFVLLPLLRNLLPAVVRIPNDSLHTQRALRYPSWLYVDRDPQNETYGKTKLSSEVAEYAKSRYDLSSSCGDRGSLWHVFLHTALGRPLAIEFDRTSNVVRSIRRIDRNIIADLVLRDSALCVDSWLESQFQTREDRDKLQGQRARRSLLNLCRRYAYRIEWRKQKVGYKLAVVITDSLLRNDHTFELTGFRPTVVTTDPDGDSGGGDGDTTFDSLLPEWRITRASVNGTTEALSVDTTTAGSNAPINDPLAGTRTYENSPCYDPILGRQTTGRKAVKSLNEFERIYLRGIGGSYASVDRPELERSLNRFYYDCRYDTDVTNELSELIDSSTLLPGNVFGIQSFLRVCPPDRPNFDRNSGQCVV